jgi:putative oxidoreductase
MMALIDNRISLLGCQRKTLETFMANNSVLVLIGRILLSFMFILSGYGKLTAIGGTAGYFGSLGFPAPTVVAILVGLLELGGGLAVLVGFQTRIAALALGLFTLAATAAAHLDWSGDAGAAQFLFFQKNLGIAGGFFLLAAYGAGALSLDAKRG